MALPKRYRTEEHARQLVSTAIATKMKKLRKYEKEYLAIKGRSAVPGPFTAAHWRTEQESNAGSVICTLFIDSLISHRLKLGTNIAHGELFRN